jgi:hypothetical protein
VDQLDFSDITTQEIQVKLPNGKECVLREASGADAVKYRNMLSSSAKLSADGKMAKVENIADSEPYLVHLCLFEVKDRNGSTVRVQVPLEEVKALPNRVMKVLYDKVKEISGLALEEETKEVLEKRKAEVEKKLKDIESEEDSKNS